MDSVFIDLAFDFSDFSDDQSQSHGQQPDAAGGLAAILRCLPQQSVAQSQATTVPNAAIRQTTGLPQTPTPIRPPQVITQQQQQTWPLPQQQQLQQQRQPATIGYTPSHTSQPSEQQLPPQFSRAPPQSITPGNGTSQVPPSVPMAVVLGIVDSSMPLGGWELNETDVQNLLNVFGPTEWMKVLCSPLGSGRVPDCVIAKFRDPSATQRIEAELDGTSFNGIGRLVLSSFPSSLLDGVADEASLAALVSSRIQAKSTTASQGTGAPQTLPDDTATIASVLAQALGATDAQALLTTEAGRNAVAAVKADPSLISAIQSQVQALSSQTTTPTHPTTTIQGDVDANRPRKRVCRLELIDLFGHHPEFDVASLIVGQENSNIKYVLEEAKQKVDIDLDGVPYNAAPIAERLHLTVTAIDEEAYTIAVDTLEDLLSSICRQFEEFCQKRHLGPVTSAMGFKRHEYMEGPDGQLMYLGQKERPKSWMEQQPLTRL